MQLALSRDNLDILDWWDGDANATAGFDVTEDKNLSSLVAPGFECFSKVILVEELEYDEEIICTHAFNETCYQVYSTVYKPVKVRTQEPNFEMLG